MIARALTDVPTLTWSRDYLDPTLPPEGWEDPDTVVDLRPAGADAALDDLPPLDFGEPYLS